jgi:diaminopimelate epimerase
MGSPALRFAKYEGLGNDFIVVDGEDCPPLTPDDARALCDRRFGVGADGVLVVSGTRSDQARMRVMNADGSVPEMCGNGLRCAALHVARARGSVTAEIPFETDAGARPCVVDDTDGAGLVTIDMGVVRVGETRDVHALGEVWTVTLADAGNPHAIVHAEVPRERHVAVGAALSTHSVFPRGTNVELVRFGEGAVDLVVFERGVGLTLACGTGACATVAVACRAGKLAYREEISVRLPGGTLFVTVEPDGRATMRGPARRVFEGEVRGWRANPR